MKGISIAYSKLEGTCELVGIPEENETGLVSITILLKADNTNLLCQEHQAILEAARQYINPNTDINSLSDESKQMFFEEALNDGLHGEK